MKNILRKGLISIYQRVIEILEEKNDSDFSKLKTLSDEIIQDSMIFQDDDSISAAVIVYSLAKLIDRGIPDRTYDVIFTKIVAALMYLEHSDKNNYRKKVKEIFDTIQKADKRLRLYVGDVISQAQMKKAGKIYRNGISVGIISEMMGISQWDLLSYLGNTNVVGDTYDPKDIRKRLEFARSLFESY